MLKKIFMVSVFAAAICGCISPERTAYTQDEMDCRLWYFNYTCEETGITLQSRVFVPGPNDKKYPLVLFLHGAGQKGTDNKSHLYENDIGKLIYYSDNNSKAVIAVPQCPPNKEWADEDMITTLDSYIQTLPTKIFIVDTTKAVSIAGFSMGGIGTYKLAMYNPERYKVLMPICGGPRAWWEPERPDVPEEMKDVSIWAFNNVNDTVVDNLYSKYVISQIWQNENSDAHYTEQRNGHCDEYVFSDKANLEWFLSRKKPLENKTGRW